MSTTARNLFLPCARSIQSVAPKISIFSRSILIVTCTKPHVPLHHSGPAILSVLFRRHINPFHKQLTATHKHTAALFNKTIEEDQILQWLTAGITFLIPKTRILKIQALQPCDLSLPTMCTLVTSIICRRMQI